MSNFDSPNYRAMICGGGSVLAERFDFTSAEDASAWIRQQYKTVRNVERGLYRVCLDDASWTVVPKPREV